MSTALSPLARLEAREQGARLHPIDRSLVLLRLAGADPAEDLAALPIGTRDRRLLAHRRATFGDRLDCLIDCPACSAAQEFELSAAALMAALDQAPIAPAEVTLGDWRIGLRPLASRDQARAARAQDPETGAMLLLAQAVASAEGPDGADASALPTSLWPEIEAAVSAREAQGEIALDFGCADCGHSWTAAFDIGACFWREVEADARRLLGEVAALAERFGWTEGEVLALPPTRRRAYLELIGAT